MKDVILEILLLNLIESFFYYSAVLKVNKMKLNLKDRKQIIDIAVLTLILYLTPIVFLVRYYQIPMLIIMWIYLYIVFKKNVFKSLFYIVKIFLILYGLEYAYVEILVKVGILSKIVEIFTINTITRFLIGLPMRFIEYIIFIKRGVVRYEENEEVSLARRT